MFAAVAAAFAGVQLDTDLEVCCAVAGGEVERDLLPFGEAWRDEEEMAGHTASQAARASCARSLIKRRSDWSLLMTANG